MADSFDAQVGRNIRTYRRKRGISQEKLAQRADLTLSFIGVVERGRKGLSAKSVYAIARALDVPVQKLYEGVPERPPLAAEKPLPYNTPRRRKTRTPFPKAKSERRPPPPFGGHPGQPKAPL